MSSSGFRAGSHSNDADFDELAMAYLDSACTDRQFTDFQTALRDSSDYRRRFLALCEWAESCAEITDARLTADAEVRRLDHTEVAEGSSIVRPRWPLPSKLAAAAMVAGLAALFVMVMVRWQAGPGEAGSSETPVAGTSAGGDSLLLETPPETPPVNPSLSEEPAGGGLSLLDPQPRGLVLISYSPIASLNPLVEARSGYGSTRLPGDAPQVSADWLKRVDLWSVDRRDAEPLLSDVENLQPIRL